MRRRIGYLLLALALLAAGAAHAPALGTVGPAFHALSPDGMCDGGGGEGNIPCE